MGNLFWRTLCILSLLGLISPLLRAEGRPDPVPFEESPSTTFAIVYPLVHPFFETVTEEAISYGRERGVDLVFRAPEGKDVPAQIAMMDELISMGVDGIALCATDPAALVPSVNRAMDAGIPVIAFESDLPDSRRICFLGTDNYNAGREMGHLLARMIGPEGRVIICNGLSTQMSLRQRVEGIQDALDDSHPGVQIVDISSGEGDPQLTHDVIEAQIAAHPDFDAFTSIDATGGPVAVSIWKARGWRTSDHMIVTFDDMPQNLDAIRSGIVAGVVSQRQWTWGQLIIDRLLAIRAGQTVPEYEDTGTVVITKENVNSYRD